MVFTDETRDGYKPHNRFPPDGVTLLDIRKIKYFIRVYDAWKEKVILRLSNGYMIVLYWQFIPAFSTSEEPEAYYSATHGTYDMYENIKDVETFMASSICEYRSRGDDYPATVEHFTMEYMDCSHMSIGFAGTFEKYLYTLDMFESYESDYCAYKLKFSVNGQHKEIVITDRVKGMNRGQFTTNFEGNIARLLQLDESLLQE